MVQAITPELTALLKSKLQVGSDGFRGELEIDWVQSSGAATYVQKVSVVHNGAGNARTTLAAPVTAGNLLVAVLNKAGSIGISGGVVLLHGTLTDRDFDHFAGSPIQLQCGAGGCDELVMAYRIATGDEQDLDWGIQYVKITLYEVAGADDPTTFEVATATGTDGALSAPGPTSVKDIGTLMTPGSLQIFAGEWANIPVGGRTYLDQTIGPGWTLDTEDGLPSIFGGGEVSHPAYLAGHATSGPDASFSGPGYAAWGGIVVGITGVAIPPQTLRLDVAAMTVDRSRKMVAAQLDATISNENSDRGWYTQSSPIVAPNNPIRAYAWYGDRANRVEIFRGLLDRVHEGRDPKLIGLKARSRMKWLLEQKFAAVASQDPTVATAIRTEANGVYVGRSPEYVVADILDRAGWPSADRAIDSTGLTIDEYDLADKTSWAEQIAGADRLTAIAGFDFVEDELAVVHFEANALADVSEPAEDYAFAAGVDVLKLDHEIDDEDRATRVTVSGPMTLAVPTWKQSWATTEFLHPVGVMYVDAAPTYIYVIDRITQYLSKVRQSDRAITARWPLGASLTNQPIGLSKDPTDPLHFYVLDAHLPGSGVYTNCKVRKYAFAAPTVAVATTTLPDGQWSDMKFDGTHLWLTNFADDKLYEKTFVAGGAAGATASFTYAGHTNPTGLYLDGTTIGLFFNGGAEFYKVDTGAPGTITGTQSTAGTDILGGEIDTTTHTDLYATNEAGDFGAAAGHLWKFALATLVTTTVVKLAANQALEDALGVQSGIANRVHDLHPLDGAHPFEIRPAYFEMKLVQSEQQAEDVAAARLVLLERLRRTMDLATLGNPAIQINDVVRYTDPIANIDSVWLLDSYRASLSGEGGTYTTAMSVLPWESS